MPTPSDWPISLELIELVLLVVGAAMFLALITAFFRKQDRLGLRVFPSPVLHGLTEIDVIAAGMIFLLVPSYLSQFWSMAAGGAATRDQASLERPASESEMSSDEKVVTTWPAESRPTSSAADAPPLPDPRLSIPQAAGSLTAVVLMLLLAQARFVRGLRGLFPPSPSPGRLIVWALIVYLAAWPVCFGLLVAAQALIVTLQPEWTIPVHASLRLLHDPSVHILYKTATVVTALLLAPLSEELFFRGILQSALADRLRSDWAAIIISGAVFGWIHYPLINTIPALMFFGWVLGFAYARSRSLALPVLIHVVFNAKTLLWMAAGADPTA